MPTIKPDRQTVSIDIPTLGLNTALPGQYIDPRYSPKVDNVRFYQGEIRNRPGIRDYPSDTPQSLLGIPNGGHLFSSLVNVQHPLVSTEAGIYEYDFTVDRWVSRTQTLAAFAGTASDPWVFATVNDSVLATNGIDQIHSWDGTPSSDFINVVDASAHAARYIVAFAGRAVAAYMSESGVVADRVRWSSQNDPAANWDPASFLDAGFADMVDLPGPITGMVPIGGHNYITKERGIIRMTETGLLLPQFVFQTVVDGIGCLEGQSIVQVGGGLTFFLGEENVYQWDGISRPVPIGTSIRNELFDILNRSRLRQIFAFHHALFNEYWLCIPLGTETNQDDLGGWPARAYIYNYVERAWGRADLPMSCHVPSRTTGTFLTIDEITFAIDDWVTAIDSGFGGEFLRFPVLGQPVAIAATAAMASANVGGADREFIDTTAEFISQGFLATTASVNHIGIDLKINTGAPTGTVAVAVYTNSAGEPSAVVPGLDFTDFSDLLVGEITGSYQRFDFQTLTSVALTAATHHVVIRHLGAGPSDTIACEVDTANGFADGILNFSTDGSAWTPVSGTDMDFIVGLIEAGRMRKIDDLVIGDEDADVVISFDTSDKLFKNAEGLNIEATIDRVIVTIRDKGSLNLTGQISGDGGSTFTALGTIAFAGTSDSSTKRLVFNTRATFPQIRIRLATPDPIAIHAIEVEYFERAEIR